MFCLCFQDDADEIPGRSSKYIYIYIYIYIHNLEIVMIRNLCYQAIEQVYLIKWLVRIYIYIVSNQPITRQQLNAFRHLDVVKTTC